MCLRVQEDRDTLYSAVPLQRAKILRLAKVLQVVEMIIMQNNSTSKCIMVRIGNMLKKTKKQKNPKKNKERQKKVS